MKPYRIAHISTTIAPALLSLGLAFTASAQTGGTITDFRDVVPVQIGDIEFSPGDSIIIERVSSDSATIRTGGVYCVEGSYTLASRDEALLSISATTVKNVSTPIEPTQTMHVQKGSGTFRLVKTMWEEGYLHASFSPWPNGSSFGGVYFGQNPWVLRHKNWSWLDQQTRPSGAATPATVAGAPVSVTGPNQVLLEYLGDPVEPPADMDAAYSKEGLIRAVQEAAQNAGVTLKRVEIEDSEYPFLVGTICKEGDFAKLTAQLRKLPDYSYNGCISSSTHAAFNIVPYRVFPRQFSERITHRSGLRSQVFMDKLAALESACEQWQPDQNSEKPLIPSSALRVPFEYPSKAHRSIPRTTRQHPQGSRRPAPQQVSGANLPPKSCFRTAPAPLSYRLV